MVAKFNALDFKSYRVTWAEPGTSLLSLAPHMITWLMLLGYQISFEFLYVYVVASIRAELARISTIIALSDKYLSFIFKG